MAARMATTHREKGRCLSMAHFSEPSEPRSAPRSSRETCRVFDVRLGPAPTGLGRSKTGLKLYREDMQHSDPHSSASLVSSPSRDGCRLCSCPSNTSTPLFSASLRHLVAENRAELDRSPIDDCCYTSVSSSETHTEGTRARPCESRALFARLLGALCVGRRAM
jgi:hypothetical protein